MRHLIVGLVGLILAFGVLAEAKAEPILRYTFDDQTEPTRNSGTLGQAYDGQLYGHASFVPFGSGSAVSLDGDGDFVIPGADNSAFNIGDGDFSLFARIQTSNSEPGQSFARMVVCKEHKGSDPGYVLSVRRDSGIVWFALTDGSQSAPVLSTQPVNDGVPHDLLGVREGDTLRLFVDGIPDNTANVPPGFGSTHNPNNLVIGGRSLSALSEDDFKGIIDEAAVFAYAIPEPSTLVLLATGAFGLLAYGWRVARSLGYQTESPCTPVGRSRPIGSVRTGL